MDDLDRLLLQATASIGTFYPKAEYEKERAPRLAEVGYLRAVRPFHGSDMPVPPVGYELTPEGKAALAASIERSNTLTGEGTVKRDNSDALGVAYRVTVHYKSTIPPTITKIEAEITGPPETVRTLADHSGTLVLKGGQQLDGFCNTDGRFALGNLGSAIRGELT